MIKNGLIGCTTDGAPSMLGQKSGFQAYLKTVSPNATFVHCFIHRFALSSKTLPPELLSCLNRIIKMMNFVKSSALNTWVFERLGEDLGSEHKCLLCHTEVRWLSLGNMTRRVFELVGFSFWCRNPILRFGVLPRVDVACEECCRCMQRCWFPQTLPTRQSSRSMSTDLTPD